jgi:hypothetical protein
MLHRASIDAAALPLDAIPSFGDRTRDFGALLNGNNTKSSSASAVEIEHERASSSVNNGEAPTSDIDAQAVGGVELLPYIPIV